MRTFNHIGKLIRAARERRGISQGDMAQLVGYSNQYISNTERKLCSIPAKAIVPFARALDIPTSTIRLAMIRDYNEYLDRSCNQQQ